MPTVLKSGSLSPLSRLVQGLLYIIINVRVNYPLFLSYFKWTWISSTYFQKLLKCHENSSSGHWVVPCRQTDIAKLIVAFHNFANKSKSSVRKQASQTNHWTGTRLDYLWSEIDHTIQESESLGSQPLRGYFVWKW